MIRKIILHGRSSYTISLPQDWIKRFNINKGDEVDITQEGNRLIISTTKDLENETRHVDVRNLSSVLPKIIAALYKSGFDEIRITFEDSKQKKIILNVIDEEFIGFELVSDKENSLIAKKVSAIMHKEFDMMLKRGFQIAITMGEDILLALKKMDRKEMKKVIGTDMQLNKLVSFCVRALNKRDLENMRKSKTIYSIVQSIEKIGDAYKDLAQALIDNQFKISKRNRNLLEELNLYFREFYELFYKFDLLKFESFYSKRDHFLKRIYAQECEDFKVALCLYRIFNSTYDLNGPILIASL